MKKKIKDLTEEDKKNICEWEDGSGDCYCKYALDKYPYCLLEKDDEETLNMEVEVLNEQDNKKA